MFDLLIQNGLVVASDGVRPSHLAVRAGRVAALIEPSARRTQRGRSMPPASSLPGQVELSPLSCPSEKAGIDSGTRAGEIGADERDGDADDMPMTATAEQFVEKKERAQGRSFVDFASGGSAPTPRACASSRPRERSRSRFSSACSAIHGGSAATRRSSMRWRRRERSIGRSARRHWMMTSPPPPAGAFRPISARTARASRPRCRRGRGGGGCARRAGPSHRRRPAAHSPDEHGARARGARPCRQRRGRRSDPRDLWLTNETLLRLGPVAKVCLRCATQPTLPPCATRWPNARSASWRRITRRIRARRRPQGKPICAGRRGDFRASRRCCRC